MRRLGVLAAVCAVVAFCLAGVFAGAAGASDRTAYNAWRAADVAYWADANAPVSTDSAVVRARAERLQQATISAQARLSVEAASTPVGRQARSLSVRDVAALLNVARYEIEIQDATVDYAVCSYGDAACQQAAIARMRASASSLRGAILTYLSIRNEVLRYYERARIIRCDAQGCRALY